MCFDGRWDRDVGPFWRRAPMVLALYPAWVVAVAIAVGLLTAARVSAPMMVDAGADAAVTRAMAAVPPEAPSAKQPVVRANVDQTTERFTVVEPLRDALDRIPGLEPPTLTVRPYGYLLAPSRATPVVRVPGDDRSAAGVVMHRSGAMAALDGRGDRSAEGVWLPDDIANVFDVGVGDTVELALDDASASTAVAGVYRTGDGDVLPHSETLDWARLRPDLPPTAEDRSETASLVLADRQTYRRLASALGEQSLVSWVAEPAGSMTVAQVRAASRRANTLAASVASVETPLGRTVMDDLGFPAVQIVTGLPSLVERARETTALMRPVIAALSFAGQLIALTAIGLVTAFLLRRRRTEFDILSGQGAGPISVGVRVGIELVPALVVGAVAGWVAARALVTAVGPSPRVSAAVLTASRNDVLVVALVAFVVVTVVATGRAWTAGRVSTGRAEEIVGRVRWEPVLLVATAAAAVRVFGSSGGPGGDLLSVSLPVLVLFAVPTLVVRLLDRWHVPSSGLPVGVTSRRLVSWLARRRVMAGGRAAATTVIVGATGLGLVAYTVRSRPRPVMPWTRRPPRLLVPLRRLESPARGR